jgi:hypothetical protein
MEGMLAFFAVHSEMSVKNKLSGFFSGRSKAQSVNNVVETALTDLQQVFARYALFACSHIEIFRELAFEDSIVTSGLLFCAKLNSVFGRFSCARFAVLTGNRCSAADGTLVGVASFTLEEQFLVLSAAESAYSTGISCHELHLLIGLTPCAAAH